ncbi:MAG: hypothetical protein ACLUUF_02195 [Bifidobacterium pullorum]
MTALDPYKEAACGADGQHDHRLTLDAWRRCPTRNRICAIQRRAIDKLELDYSAARTHATVEQTAFPALGCPRIPPTPSRIAEQETDESPLAAAFRRRVERCPHRICDGRARGVSGLRWDRLRTTADD